MPGIIPSAIQEVPILKLTTSTLQRLPQQPQQPPHPGSGLETAWAWSPPHSPAAAADPSSPPRTAQGVRSVSYLH